MGAYEAVEHSDTIRPTVRAVIRQGDQILVQVKRSETGQRYLTLPGGRQEFGETVEACLLRECAEEIGVTPQIGGLCHLADVVRDGTSGTRHLVEMLFECQVPVDYVPRMGPRPDKRQVATIWADPVAEGAAFLPRYDQALMRPDTPVYLGRFDCVTP